MGDDTLTKSEFLAHIGYLREDVAGVNHRLDTLNGQTRKHGESIAVLEERTKAVRRTGSVWGAAGGTFVGGVLVALYQYFGGNR